MYRVIISTEMDREAKLRLRLDAARRSKDGGADVTSKSKLKSADGKRSTLPEAVAEDLAEAARAPTEEEKKAITIELLKQNAEMRHAWVQSYYLVHAVVALVAGYLLMVQFETPWSGDALHLSPMKEHFSDSQMQVFLGLMIATMALCAGAGYSNANGFLTFACFIVAWPCCRVGWAMAVEADLRSQWQLAWLPLACPAVIGVQVFVNSLFTGMDKQVLDVYKRAAADDAEEKKKAKGKGKR